MHHTDEEDEDDNKNKEIKSSKGGANVVKGPKAIVFQPKQNIVTALTKQGATWNRPAWRGDFFFQTTN